MSRRVTRERLWSTRPAEGTFRLSPEQGPGTFAYFAPMDQRAYMITGGGVRRLGERLEPAGCWYEHEMSAECRALLRVAAEAIAVLEQHARAAFAARAAVAAPEKATRKRRACE